MSASKAMPQVIPPSPMTQTTRASEPAASNAVAMPRPAEMDVPAWATPNASCGLSFRTGKPDSPPYCRMVPNRERRPVSSLWP